ncbi:MAG: hypothetical protein ACRDJC_25295 [Thermomicrobiales bacterium]
MLRRESSSVTDPPADRDRSFHWSLAGAALASLCCLGPLVAILVAGGAAAGAVGLVRFKFEFIAAGLVVTLIGIALALRKSEAGCSIKDYRRNRVLIPAVSLLTFAVLVAGSNLLLLDDRVIDAASARMVGQSAASIGDAQPAAAPQRMITEPALSTEVEAPPIAAAPQRAISDPALPALGGTQPAAQAPQPVPLSARQLDVAITSGVYCPACLLAIQKQLTDTPGVQRVAFGNAPDGNFAARVVYDSAQVDQPTLLTTIAEAPGALGGGYGTKVLGDAPIG